jgi:RNA-binding protein YhbY
MSLLFNLGDSKLTEIIEKELQKQMQATKTFSDDISMECWLDQHAEIVFKVGKLGHSENLILDVNREIRQL